MEIADKLDISPKGWFGNIILRRILECQYAYAPQTAEINFVILIFSVKSRIFGYILYLLESWAMLKDPAVHQAAAGSLAHKIGKGGKSSKGGFHLAGFSTAPPAHRERFA